MTEYEALVRGLLFAHKKGAKCLKVQRDSELVVKQVRSQYVCHDKRLAVYRNRVWDLIEDFDSFDTKLVSRKVNRIPDALAVAARAFEDQIIDEEDKSDDLNIEDLMLGNLTIPKYVDPESPVIQLSIGKITIPNKLVDLGAAINVMTNETKTKLSLEGLRPTPIVLQMVDRSLVKLEGVIEDVVLSIDSWDFPTDYSGWVSPLVVVLKKNGKWHICVDYRALNKATKKDHLPLPFIDQVLDTLAEVYMDDFTVHGNTYEEAKANLEKVLKRYQGPQFTSELIAALVKEYEIRHRKSTPYHPQANGQVEVTNRELENILTKVVALHMHDWAMWLPEAVWAYHTMWKTTIGLTPYELVYGKKAIILIEFKIKTLQTTLQLSLSLSDAQKDRIAQLHSLDELCQDALFHTEVIQK
ncbi:uncharacterized protein LOC131860053 [Cryptomeria japonica]|uniref:uncharacterized protein LOC131860053 n=1 Tax=Cryptomeria japonica TaxID=3369 RepID=UPI0027DA6D2A|nr:uncharacterized protein LOC131860053 [Cryptomeria japonica]